MTETASAAVSWPAGAWARTLSAVVCTYDTSRLLQLEAAVQSLTDQTLSPVEVIVVVDGNSELASIVREKAWPVTVIERADRGGSAAACNTGIEHSHGDLVAFLDDDAIADPDWLAWLAKAMESPDILGAGGFSEPLWEATGPPRWFPDELLWAVGCSYRGLPEDPGKIRNVFGGCACFPRSLFTAVGLFNETLGRHGGDMVGGYEAEFCIRASKAARGTFLYEPRARIRHRVPAARSTFLYLLRRCFCEGQSKALLAALAGNRLGLSDEARFFTQVVPRAIAQRFSPSRLARRGAYLQLAALLVCTSAAVCGYVTAFCSARRRAQASVAGMLVEQERDPAGKSTLLSGPKARDRAIGDNG
jgi:GT2 family glycosyltransferase